MLRDDRTAAIVVTPEVTWTYRVPDGLTRLEEDRGEPEKTEFALLFNEDEVFAPLAVYYDDAFVRRIRGQGSSPGVSRWMKIAVFGGFEQEPRRVPLSRAGFVGFVRQLLTPALGHCRRASLQGGVSDAAARLQQQTQANRPSGYLYHLNEWVGVLDDDGDSVRFASLSRRVTGDCVGRCVASVASLTLVDGFITLVVSSGDGSTAPDLAALDREAGDLTIELIARKDPLGALHRRFRHESFTDSTLPYWSVFQRFLQSSILMPVPLASADSADARS